MTTARAEVTTEIPAHDAGIERAVLGLVLQADGGSIDLLARVAPDHFFIDKNRIIRARLGAMAAEGKALDLHTLTLALRTAGELDMVGGLPYLSQLFEEATVPAHAGTYVGELIELWAKRELLMVGKRLGAQALNGARAGDLLRSTTARLEELAAATLPPVEARLRILSWAEMTSAPVEPVSYHWPGWVPLATVALLAGAGDSLKSWLALLLAINTASGQAPFVAQEETEDARLRGGPVLYITAENALAEEQRRCGLLKAGLGLPDELPMTFLPAENLSLGRDEDYAAVLRLVDELRPIAIFIDSSIAVSGIVQENDNPEVRSFMKHRVLPLSRKYGATVYLIAHSGKPPTQPGQRFTDEHAVRGASDWRNAADVVLHLRRDATLGPQAVVLRHAKVRMGPRHAPIWFNLEDIDSGRAIRVVLGGTYADESGQGALSGLARAITAAIDALKASGGGLYVAGLEKQVTGPGISRATARRAVDVIRGKKPWGHGPLAGKKHPVVVEDRHGKSVFLAFDAAQAPADEDFDDA